MKSYPSIPKNLIVQEPLHFFDKCDGSNLRFEWSKKQGWYKSGTRTHLFDQTDPCFGPAIPIFQETMADRIAQVAQANKWESLIVFAEFWGAGSFAGKHKPDEQKFLTLFDVAPYKKGILGPEEFLALFGGLGVSTAPYLGKHKLTPDFIETVRSSAFPGITFEGVVGKVGSGHKLQMVKVKTQAWIDKVKTIYTPEQAALLIAS